MSGGCREGDAGCFWALFHTSSSVLVAIHIRLYPFELIYVDILPYEKTKSVESPDLRFNIKKTSWYLIREGVGEMADEGCS